jgi:hypothetical protein
VVQRNQQARRVLDLAREEADLLGHCYLGPEHLVLGMLRGGDGGAARALRTLGMDLLPARAAMAGLAARGVVPGPRPSDADLLGLFGIDLAAVRRATEQRFGRRAVGSAIREATRARRGGTGRVPRTPLRDPPWLVDRVLYHAGEQARGARPLHGRPGAAAARGGQGHPDPLAQVHAEPVAAAAARLGRPAQGLPRRRRAAARQPRRGPGPPARDRDGRAPAGDLLEATAHRRGAATPG